MKVNLRMMERLRTVLMITQAEDCSSMMLAVQTSLTLSQSLGMKLVKIHVIVATSAVKPTSKRMNEPLPDLTTQFSSDWATTTKSRSTKRTGWISSMKKRNGTSLTSY